MTYRITLPMLRGACKEQRAIFKREWPKGADATIANVRRAQELGLSLAWGTKWFTEVAWAAYQEAIATAWAAYEAPTATAWAAYQAPTGTAWLAAFNQSMAEKEATT